MKKLLVIWVLGFVCNLSGEDVIAAMKESVLFKALEDELARTTKKLQMENMSRPYYVAYKVEETEAVMIEASFGAIISSDYSRTRNLFIDLRVGSYEFDNSNFVSGTVFQIERGARAISLPIEDDYDAIRYQIWLGTDGSYKRALEELSKKEATIANRVIKDKVPDFTKVKPTIYEESLMPFRTAQKELESLLIELSKVFWEFKKIQSSKLKLKTEVIHRYFVDSEGSKHICNEPLTYLEVYASTQSVDGDELNDMIGFYGRTLDDLPAKELIRNKIAEFAEEFSVTQGIAKSDEYIGPVLFTGDASAQLFYEIIGKGLSNPRHPLFENEQYEGIFVSQEGFLVDKLGRSILPATFYVYDDPRIKSWNNVPLIGNFQVDEQGVGAQKIELIKDGKVVGLLMSRIPTKKLKETNGHARRVGGADVGWVANLIIENKGPTKDIKNEFIKLLKDNGLEYGIVITRLKGAMPKEREEMMNFFFQVFTMGEAKKKLLSDPVCGYKLYTDGHTEPVQGMEFEGITYKTLVDIIITGEEKRVYNFLEHGMFGSELPISVVAPSVVIEEMELTQAKTKPKKLPVVPHPYFK